MPAHRKVGITGYTTKSHICRAILESIAFQTKAVLGAMRKDSGQELKELNVPSNKSRLLTWQVDGGLSQSEEMMQIQANMLNISIHRPEMTEITALGAAIAAGLAKGVWKDVVEMEKAFENHHIEDVFTGEWDETQIKKRWDLWEWGVQKSFGWVRDGLQDLSEANSKEKRN